MNNVATFRVFRFDPEVDKEPRFEEFHFTVKDPVPILVALSRIQKEQDPTLAFRDYCCGLQLCGSCLLKINGKKQFACHQLVKGGETLTLEPLYFPEDHIRDLVCIPKE
jgi:succinate dehydrogenase / fumarate reductase iron-sulfur subunit